MVLQECISESLSRKWQVRRSTRSKKTWIRPETDEALLWIGRLSAAKRWFAAISSTRLRFALREGGLTVGPAAWGKLSIVCGRRMVALGLPASRGHLKCIIGALPNFIIFLGEWDSLVHIVNLGGCGWRERNARRIWQLIPQNMHPFDMQSWANDSMGMVRFILSTSDNRRFANDPVSQCCSQLSSTSERFSKSSWMAWYFGWSIPQWPEIRSDCESSAKGCDWNEQWRSESRI